MSQHSSIIRHIGVVEEITEDGVCVSITSASACSTCAAGSSCSMSEQAEKKIVVRNCNVPVEKGERVMLVMHASTGLKSAFIAYVLPIILLVAGVGLSSAFALPEGLAALIGLSAVLLYYFILFLMRRVLEKRLTIRIEKL